MGDHPLPDAGRGIFGARSKFQGLADFSASPNLWGAAPTAQARIGVAAAGAGGHPLWRGLEWEPPGSQVERGGSKVGPHRRGIPGQALRVRGAGK